MKTLLDLTQRIWLIEAIGSLASTTALIKEADSFIGFLAPKEAEITTEGLNFTADENGLSWDKEVEANSIPKLEVEIPELSYSLLKAKYSNLISEPTTLDLEMITLLGL